jgi:hypothetical protein
MSVEAQVHNRGFLVLKALLTRQKGVSPATATLAKHKRKEYNATSNKISQISH